VLILWLILALALVALAFAVGTLTALLRTGIPAVPSSQKRIRWFLDNYPLPTSGTLADLGCGDARFLIEAKRRSPELRCVGYELSPWEMARARWNARRAGVRIELHASDFFRADLSNATAVYCYLLDSLLPRVAEKLEHELPKGAVVIAHAFPFPNWKPSATLRNPEDPRGPFYVYNR
jgi:hypothetical protein